VPENFAMAANSKSNFYNLFFGPAAPQKCQPTQPVWVWRQNSNHDKLGQRRSIILDNNNDHCCLFLGFHWHVLWCPEMSLNGNSRSQPLSVYWQLIGLNLQKVSWSNLPSAKRKSLQPVDRNLHGNAIMAINLSKTTLGASTKVCLHTLQEVSLDPDLQARQTTCPFRHWMMVVPQNFLHNPQVNKLVKSSYLRRPSIVVIPRRSSASLSKADDLFEAAPDALDDDLEPLLMSDLNILRALVCC
jgi:hypothetical protein